MELPWPDFTNTENAFSHLSNTQLFKARWLFKMFNQKWIVNIGSKITLLGIKYRIPGFEAIVKGTIYEQFCAGTSLLECQKNIDILEDLNVKTILDYGAEAKEHEQDFNLTMNQTIRSIEYATTKNSIPVVSTKITGLGRFALLEKLDRKENLNEAEILEYKNIIKRIDAICYNGSLYGISIYIDAEESWIQNTIDDVANQMMERYNKEKVIVFNTVQMYRHDRLAFVERSINEAKKRGYLLGLKIVRGAYIEKENLRALEMNYPTPIQPNKFSTDKDYDDSIKVCLNNFEFVSICCATHNEESSRKFAALLDQHNIARDHGARYVLPTLWDE